MCPTDADASVVTRGLGIKPGEGEGGWQGEVDV